MVSLDPTTTGEREYIDGNLTKGVSSDAEMLSNQRRTDFCPTQQKEFKDTARKGHEEYAS